MNQNTTPRWSFWAFIGTAVGLSALLALAFWNSPHPQPQASTRRVSLLEVLRGTNAEAAGNLDGTGSAQLVSGSAPLARREATPYEEEGLALEEVLPTEQGDGDVDSKVRQLSLSLPDLRAPEPVNVDMAQLSQSVLDSVQTNTEPTFDHDAVWVEHTVAKGETLSVISEKYHIKAETLLKVNNLSNAHKLAVGQVLIVPKGEEYAAEAREELIERQARVKAEEEHAEKVTFSEYTIVSGDSLWTIAGKFNLSIDTLLGVNNLKSDLLKPGVKIRVPNQDGVVTKVAKGDTLDKLAKKYDISAKAIALANNIDAKGKGLTVGQEIFLPGASNSVLAYRNSGSNGGLSQKAPTVAKASPNSTGRFIWPVRGRINSPFGWRIHPVLKKRWFHTGIDIKGNTGTPIAAARDGQVIFAGWMNGYGRTVIIRHDSKYTTLYAHASSILVKKGQKVKQGQTIAKVGTSGRTTGPHLHFEVRINDKPTDPMSYLR